MGNLETKGKGKEVSQNVDPHTISRTFKFIRIWKQTGATTLGGGVAGGREEDGRGGGMYENSDIVENAL